MAVSKAKNVPVVPGKHKKTVFMMAGQEGYCFLIEKIDEDVLELTIATFDDEENMRRTEYVLHCDHKSLIDLKAAINVFVGK